MVLLFYVFLLTYVTSNKHEKWRGTNANAERDASLSDTRDLPAAVVLTDDITFQSLQQTCDPQRQTLLTLFTTFNDVISRRAIHNNTLHNWASLGDDVRVVMYIDVDEVASNLTVTALALGYCVRYVPLYRQRLPVVRSMFQDVATQFRSTFYAYANSDILFDGSLVYTVRGVARTSYANIYRTTGILLIGKRTNVDVNVIRDTYHPNHVQRLKKQGKAFLSVAQDYFITTATGYPWQRVPDLVVGRPGFDNYLVIKAIDWNVTVIDATDSLTAVHQTGNDGNQASFKTTNKCLNKRLVHPFDYTRGSTLCAPYFTVSDITGKVVVGARVWFPNKCYPTDEPKLWDCKD